MWWILSVLLILIAWAVWLFFEIPTWIPIALTVGLVVLGLGLFIFRKIRARRAASALERAIAQEGEKQALNARPERRAEIQELQRQIAGGIQALKASKLGGRKRGASALYALPWYVIIGPPGAGKTTALKHSGLVFPFSAASGGGVRGVGGTRNCDWWFTNEAILLDTAGRYTTESDDRDEWIAFLQSLLKYRSRRPINGILVAISVTDLIDANEAQIEATGKKIRSRIDEVMTQLHMVVPVYVLFTKCDLIMGFAEFFNDCKKSDRAKAWGSTLRLDRPKLQPSQIFDEEFDLIVNKLHARSLKRLVMERNREARERIYQFPLEFAGLRRNLSEFIGTVFQVNAFQGTPIFRGFYFTSGTQEGKPLDRVLGRMGQAMGIQVAEGQQLRGVESKSYFLFDVFMNIVFPDGDIAARSQSEVRRQRVVRGLVAAAALALAGILAVPSIISYLNNQAFIEDTEERAEAVADIEWNDGEPATEKLVTLKPLLDRLLELDTHREEGEPWGMGWLMYSGEEMYRPTVAVYVSSLQQGFVQPVKRRLEERLKVASGEKYLQERLDLKTYLMLSEVENLDIDWATTRLTDHWASILEPTTNVPERELKHMLSGHVRYYLTLLKDEKVKPMETDEELVEDVRRVLMAVPVKTRYYDQFVNVLMTEKYDEEGDSSRYNQKYPPVTLRDMFADRPEVLEVITSAKLDKDKSWYEVDGPYTYKGHIAVLANIKEGRVFLEREQWVVPLTPEESLDQMPKHLGRLADDYEQTYIEQWTGFFEDIQVQQPTTVKEAIEIYAVLIKPDWPYLRLLRRLEDHTLWRKKSAVNEERAKEEIERQLNRQVSRRTGSIRVKVEVDKIAGRSSKVPPHFLRMVEFGVPSARGGTTAPITETPLAKYIEILTKLRSEMVKIEDSTPGADPKLLAEKFDDAIKEAETQLSAVDSTGSRLLKPLLLTPLMIGDRPGLATPGLGKSKPPPPGVQIKLPGLPQ